MLKPAESLLQHGDSNIIVGWNSCWGRYMVATADGSVGALMAS